MNEFENIFAIILAAGKSTRMGTQKLLLPWGDQTVLGHIIWTIQSTGIKDVTVITGGERDLVEAEVKLHGAKSIFNPNYDQGDMLSSIQAGMLVIPETARFCLLALGDNPQIEKQIVEDLVFSINLVNHLSKRKYRIFMPSYKMRRGHPWLIANELQFEILKLKPPESMRDFFNRHSDDISYLEVDTDSILKDLDTPEDYKKEVPGTAR